MAAKTFSATHHGIDGAVIEIEAASQQALPGIHVTGLPGDVIRESKERVRACLVGLGFDVPSSRIVVHLSPASARKQGSQFDVAIAVSVLRAEGLLRDASLSNTAFLGELTLDGRVQRITGAIALIEVLEKFSDIKTILLPTGNGWEAALLASKKVRLVATFTEVLEHLRGELELPAPGSIPSTPDAPTTRFTLDAVRGQNLAKRALEIALAGRHHLLLVGSPGVGKSMLAGCAPELLPQLSGEEWIEVVKNYSLFPSQRPTTRVRPFRSPHHTISAAGLLGGGSGTIIPGEVTLAHTGVLFLDEFPEFRRDVIEGLREPIQNGAIHLHRIGAAHTLPARFTLIAAMNPCPCGHAFSKIRRCRCSQDKITQYQKRVSGAILDRIDLWAVLGPPGKADSIPNALTAASIRKSVACAYATQLRRNGGGIRNGDLAVNLEDPAFEMESEARALFDEMEESGVFSFRALHKMARVARTIADLSESKTIGLNHLLEARGLRCPEAYRPAFG